MPIYHLVLLAIVQGLTEFLPVSSSAHLELLHRWIGTTADDLALDVAVHVGTLFAVMLYFRAEVAEAATGAADLVAGRRATRQARLALALVIATIPVVVFGAILKLTGTVELLRSLALMGWAMILFGLLLLWIDKTARGDRAIGDWGQRDAWALGLWQALALIPGTSRSGAAITGALALGYRRTDGARIAMLMSIPTIAASGILLTGDVVGSGNLALGRDLAIATLLAFLAGLAALWGMMRLLRSVDFTPYVIYRLILGVMLLILAYA